MQFWKVAVSAVGALLVGVQAESIELKGGKQIEFTDSLELGASWGVQFQLLDGTISFRVYHSFLVVGSIGRVVERTRWRHI